MKRIIFFSATTKPALERIGAAYVARKPIINALSKLTQP